MIERTLSIDKKGINPAKIIKEILKGEEGEKIKRQIAQETQGFKKPQLINYLIENFSNHSVWDKYR